MNAELYYDKIIGVFDSSGLGYDLTKIQLQYVKPPKTKDYYSITMFDKPFAHFKGVKKEYMEICPTCIEFFQRDGIKFESTTSSNNWKRVQVTPMTNFFPMAQAFFDSYEKLLRSIGFDCCSHYLECSDLKRCVYEFQNLPRVNPDEDNIMFAGQCSYRQRLKKGIIYFGKNRNI